MEIHLADKDISRNGENIRIWGMRRPFPLIGAWKYELREMYTSWRTVRARPKRLVRPGGHYAARPVRAPLNLAPAAHGN